MALMLQAKRRGSAQHELRISVTWVGFGREIAQHVLRAPN
jgi:hypothetical protein